VVGAGGYLEPASTGSGAGRRGGVLRQNWHHNRCLTGDPASARRVEDFYGHDATTRTEPAAVGRRALAKPWLNFKLASGLWPASRCPQSANQNLRAQFEPNQSLAPYQCFSPQSSAKEVEDRGSCLSRVHSLPPCQRAQNVHLHPGTVTMSLSHNRFLRMLRHQGRPSHPLTLSS
jgi:hypothetical protein